MDWSQVLLEPLKALLYVFGALIPRIVGGLAILAVGWAIAWLLRQLVARLLQAIRVDRLAEKAKLSEALRQGAIRLTFVELLGHIGYWVVIVATVIVALQFVGVTVAAEWLERFGYFIPRLIVSIVIFLVGTLIASLLGTVVRVASLNAGLAQGHLLGQTVSTAVILLTVIVALEQLQVVTRTIQVALYILLGAFGLAFALALGLGSQEFVRRYLADLWERWKTSQRP